MTQGLEIVATQQFLMERLEPITGITGGIHDGLAPVDTKTPWVVFTDLSHVDTDTIASPARLFSNSLWLVTAVCEGPSYFPIIEIAREMDLALHNARHETVADGIVLACRRVSAFRRAEVDGGVQYRRLGGIYRIYVQ